MDRLASQGIEGVAVSHTCVDLKNGTEAHHVDLKKIIRVFESTAGGPSVHALGPVSFHLTRGEFFSVVGPSGCGKSTLLEIIAGLNNVTEGEALFEGKPITGEVPDGIGIVFQEDASFGWLTVWDNIAFGLRRKGMARAEMEQRVHDALMLTGLRSFAKAYPSQLSGGMRQRVCIARTLVLQPRLILLDEPFGALDQQTRMIMGDELLKLWRQTGATVFLITHSLDEAALLSDRIGIMSARPGTFLEIFETGWSRGRDSSIISKDEKFGHITTHLWSVLREESIRAMGGERS